MASLSGLKQLASPEQITKIESIEKILKDNEELFSSIYTIIEEIQGGLEPTAKIIAGLTFDAAVEDIRRKLLFG